MTHNQRLAALALAGFAAFGGAAHATPMTISLDGVTFNDGGTASGSFTFDPSIISCCSAGSDINFTTSTTGTYTGATFDSSAANPAFAFWNALNYMSGGNSYSIIEIAAKYFGGPGQDFILLEFQNFTPGQDNLILGQGQGPFGGSYEQTSDGTTRYLTGGTATVSTAAPEPASIALLGAGIAGLGWARRKRRRAA